MTSNGTVAGKAEPCDAGAAGFLHAGGTRRATRRSERRREIAISVLIALAVGGLASWRVLSEPGVVGMVQDWSFSPFASQAVAGARQTYDGWLAAGMGFPVVYPTEYPLRFLIGLLSAAGADGQVLSKAVVAGIPIAAFVTALVAARSLGLSSAAGRLAGAFYATNPVMLNKLVSGQTSYVVGYAALPLVVAAYRAAAREARPLLGGLAVAGMLGLAAIELQLGVLGFALVLALAVTDLDVPLRRRVAIVAVAMAAGAAIELPTAVGVSGGVSALAGEAQFQLRTEWLDANSVALGEGLRLVGYLTRYASVAVREWSTIWVPASWLVAACAWAGIVLAPLRARRFMVLAAIPALVLAAGVKSPFGPLVAWLFAHVRYMQVFRELYHLMAIVALIYALGIAFLFERALDVRRALRAGRTRGFGAVTGAGIAARAAPVALVALVVVYGAPMLDGDASGWLNAFPIGRDLAPAYRAERGGSGRVLWLPMDQPLSFDHRGFGVDPMAQTARGSLWSYSLEWPLTAVDAAVRDPEATDLTAMLRLFGVTAVVERDRFRSELARFTPDGTDAARLFDRPVELRGRLGVAVPFSPSTRGYRIGGARPLLEHESRIAFVPRRLTAIVAAARPGIVPVALGDISVPNLPYSVHTDPGDAPYEQLLLARALHPLAVQTTDAQTGFAPIAYWWWYRRAYADAPGALLAIGRQHLAIRVTEPVRRAHVIVAWIATSAGGRVAVHLGTRRFVLDTNGPDGEWRSVVLDSGPVVPGATVDVDALDPHADVALRAVDVVDAARLADGARALRALEGGAQAVVAIRDAPGGVVARYATVQRGGGNDGCLCGLRRGRRYRLTVAFGTPHGAGTLRVFQEPDYTLAIRRFRPDDRGVTLEFAGVDGNARLAVSGRPWRSWILSEARPPPLRSGNDDPVGSVPDTVRADGAPATGPLLAFNVMFDRAWTVAGATAHFPSALGTSVFVLDPRRAGATVVPRYVHRTAYHVAFVAGTLVLLLCCVVAVVCVRRDREAPRCE